MVLGQFRDGFPRISLRLPLTGGSFRTVEFIVDTGFDGDLSLPPDLLNGVDADFAGDHPFLLADFTYRSRRVYRILLSWQDDERETEIISMEGNPLLGVGLLHECLLTAEMFDGGEVSVEPA